MAGERFQIGDQVVKHSGYPFPGEIRAVFTTRGDEIRYVVEATGAGYIGMLHIFSPAQLHRADIREASDAD